MDIVIASAGFGVAAACAGLMGFAIQRGATCMVAAVDEVVTRRRGDRLLGMAEAALWVLGGLLVANAIGFAMVAPAGYRVGVATVVGGALLGVGAFVVRFSAVWIPGGQLTMLVMPVAHRLTGGLILAAAVVLAVRALTAPGAAAPARVAPAALGATR